MSSSTLVPEFDLGEVTDDISRRGLLRVGAVTGAGVALGAPLLSGCGVGSGPAPSANTKPPAKPTGVLRVANNAEPSSLDPTLAGFNADLGVVGHNVYESLVDFKSDSADLVGVLAESFESSPDAREWIFTLKSGITFHDGEPLTSSAVKASLEYYAASQGAWTFFTPTGAQYDDSDPLVLRITSPAARPDLARYLTVVQVLSPKLLKAGHEAVGRTPTGTGPYRFVSYSTAKSVVLEANPDYRGPGPYLERVEFPIITDADSRNAALRSGAVDLVLAVPPASVAALRADKSVVLTEKQVWQSTKLMMFAQTPPVDNVMVRQALAHAIDRQALVKSILAGFGTVHDNWTVPGLYGYQEPETTYAYDPERAKQLLTESGVSTPIELTLLLVSDAGEPYGRLTHAIAAMLEKIGITITVKTEPGAQAAAGIFNLPDAKPWHAHVGAYGYPSGTAAQVADQRILETSLQFSDPKFSDLSAQAAATPDGPERLQLLAEAAELIAELAPVINLYAQTQIDAHRASVQGYTASNNGYLPNYGQVYLAK